MMGGGSRWKAVVVLLVVAAIAPAAFAHFAHLSVTAALGVLQSMVNGTSHG